MAEWADTGYERVGWVPGAAIHVGKGVSDTVMVPLAETVTVDKRILGLLALRIEIVNGTINIVIGL